MWDRLRWQWKASCGRRVRFRARTWILRWDAPARYWGAPCCWTRFRETSGWIQRRWLSWGTKHWRECGKRSMASLPSASASRWNTWGRRTDGRVCFTRRCAGLRCRARRCLRAWKRGWNSLPRAPNRRAEGGAGAGGGETLAIKWGAINMAGWCNGSAGFVFTWTLAHQLLGEARYLELAEKAAWNAWELREGLGNLCCGLVGQAYALLNVRSEERRVGKE